MSVKSLVEDSERLDWLDSDEIRPYVFVREENLVKAPGEAFHIDWFPGTPLHFNPLNMDEVTYVDQILNLEGKAFAKSNMVMERWVFYDCAVMPGFVAGFAHRTETLPASVKQALNKSSEREWTPISLFIIIPTMKPGEWVAHNLCSVNSLIEREQRFYGLGFLTKAFGLWYANIEVCCGVTQWNSHAKKLHSHYGAFEVLTAYTPAHNFPNTMTYRLQVDTRYWKMFFKKTSVEGFYDLYDLANFEVEPLNQDSLKSFQRKIESHEGPFFMDSLQLRGQGPEEKLKIYTPKQ